MRHSSTKFTMSNVRLKNMPILSLADVLRRRKQTLKSFVDESGQQSYEGLVVLCNKLGMSPPDEETYTKEVNPPLVTSQQDGVVVLDPPPMVDEISGRKIDPDAPVSIPEIKVVIESPQLPKKIRRNKKKFEKEPKSD